MRNKAIPIYLLFELLELDELTGTLTWKTRSEKSFEDGKISARGKCSHWNKTRAGKEAFTSSLQCTGAKRGRILGHDFMKTTVVFAMSVGRWPNGVVIHKNSDNTDYRPKNLEEISSSQKTAMSSKKGGKDTGFIGVYFDSSGGGRQRRDDKNWCVYFLGKYKGSFDLPILAAKHYDMLAIKHFGGRCKTNLPKEVYVNAS